MSKIDDMTAQLEVVEDQGPLPEAPHMLRYKIRFRGSDYPAVYNTKGRNAVQIGLVVRAGAGIPQVTEACRRFYDSIDVLPDREESEE